MGESEGRCLKQGVPSGGLGSMESSKYPPMFALIDSQCHDEGLTCVLTTVHQ